jgi:hypothetical protein
LSPDYVGGEGIEDAVQRTNNLEQSSDTITIILEKARQATDPQHRVRPNDQQQQFCPESTDIIWNQFDCVQDSPPDGLQR